VTGWAVLCSGQGAQAPDLFGRLAAFDARPVLDQVLAGRWLAPESAACLAGPAAARVAVYRNACAQPLICLYQQIVWRAIRDRTPAPALLAGLSLGELSAYGCAGSLDLRDLLHAARVRAGCMDRAAPEGVMVSVRGLDGAALQAVCADQGASLAVRLDGERATLACLKEKLDAVLAACRAAGARDAAPLAVGTASHSPWMAPAVPPFLEALRGLPIRAPLVPVLAGATGAKVFDRESVIQTLGRQLQETVRWDVCMAAMIEQGCRVFLELGPGAGLARLMGAAWPGVEARSVDEFRSPAGVAQWVRAALDRQAA